jgi:hypothetical protein
MCAAGCLVERYHLMPAPRGAEIITLEYGFISCTSLALIAVYAGYADYAGRLRLHRVFAVPLLIFPLALTLALAVYVYGMHQFGGWDEGLIVHSAVYYAHGFRPYADFPCPMPPLFMAGIRLAVAAPGLRWASLSLLAAGFAAVTCVWIYGLLQGLGVPRHWALALTLAVEASTMFLIPFWWFNNSSPIAVVLLLLSVVACLRKPEAWYPWISLAASLGMVITAKPNVVPAAAMALALFADRSRPQLAKAAAGCLGAAAVAFLICRAAQMPPAEILHAYRELAQLRGSPLLLFPFRGMPQPERAFQLIFSAVLLLYFAVLAVRAIRRAKGQWRVIAACAIAGLTTLYMVFTNSEYKTSDLCVGLVACAVLFLPAREGAEAPPGAWPALASMTIVFLVMSGFLGLLHTRILSIGQGSYYEPLPTQTIRSGFFTGLEASPRLESVISQTETALSWVPHGKVFFGPRVEFEYAVFNRTPLRGLPLLWDTGVYYSRRRLPALIRSFQEHDPDLLIFLKDDFTRMDAMAYYVLTTPTYQRIDDFHDITVFVRRRNVPLSYVPWDYAPAGISELPPFMRAVRQ